MRDRSACDSCTLAKQMHLCEDNITNDEVMKLYHEIDHIVTSCSVLIAKTGISVTIYYMCECFVVCYEMSALRMRS